MLRISKDNISDDFGEKFWSMIFLKVSMGKVFEVSWDIGS